MKRSLLVCLILLSVFAHAQQRTVLVRLFWQHPPEKIRVEARGAPAFVIDARAATKRHFIEPLRISGDGFQPFNTNGELTVEPRSGVLLLTLKMPLEEYVSAVLAGESAGFKSDEALKAMAVAARTYAVHFGSRHKAEGFDFCDTTHCQDVRLGYESARVRAAVAATEGELLWYEGRAAATYYHRSCGGELEDAKALDPELHAPYLKRHQDVYCSRSDEWHAEILKSDLSRALGRTVGEVTVVARSESGRVQRLLVNGGPSPRRPMPISGTDFRLAIGRSVGWDKVRSDLYQLEDRGDRIAFRGRGQGHGVGLCQMGADAMGQQGRNYREILAYYYPGTALGINAQGLAWQKLSGASLDVLTTSQADGATLLPAAERQFHLATERTMWSLNVRPQIKVFPDIAVYRDATGEPGWVAASTRGNVIRLQPLATLQRTNALDSTLRHEFLHMIIDANAHANTPLWLREGLVIYLADPNSVKPLASDTAALSLRLRSLQNHAATEADIRATYRMCGAAVADEVQHYGLPRVLEWIKSGAQPK